MDGDSSEKREQIQRLARDEREHWAQLGKRKDQQQLEREIRRDVVQEEKKQKHRR